MIPALGYITLRGVPSSTLGQALFLCQSYVFVNKPMLPIQRNYFDFLLYFSRYSCPHCSQYSSKIRVRHLIASACQLHLHHNLVRFSQQVGLETISINKNWSKKAEVRVYGQTRLIYYVLLPRVNPANSRMPEM